MAKRRSGPRRSISSPGGPRRGRTTATDTKALGTIASVTGTRTTWPPLPTRCRERWITPSRSTEISSSASGQGDSMASSAVSPTVYRRRLGVSAIRVPAGSRSGASSGPATYTRREAMAWRPSSSVVLASMT